MTSERPQEKIVSLEVSKLIFSKSLASRFSDNEVLQKCPFICEVRTLRHACNIFGKDNLVRRFNSGDFTIIIPLYAVTENFINYIMAPQLKPQRGSLFLLLNMKATI